MPPFAVAPCVLPARLPRLAWARWRAASMVSVAGLLSPSRRRLSAGDRQTPDDGAMRHRTGHRRPLMSRSGAGVSARSPRTPFFFPPPTLLFSFAVCATCSVRPCAGLLAWEGAHCTCCVVSRAATGDTGRRACCWSAHWGEALVAQSVTLAAVGLGGTANSPLRLPRGSHEAGDLRGAASCGRQLLGRSAAWTSGGRGAAGESRPERAPLREGGTAQLPGLPSPLPPL